jgi:hypothetical protein
MTSKAVKLALSVDDAAIAADVCRDVIYGAIRKGQLIARKNGRRTFILLPDLEQYLRSLPTLKLDRVAPAT